MNIENHEIVIFNPNYRIKNDVSRQILYAVGNSTVSSYSYSLKWRSTIHPFFGALFSSFDTQLPFGKVCEQLCTQLGISKRLSKFY